MEKYIESAAVRERITAALSDAQRKKLREQRTDILDDIAGHRKEIKVMKGKIKNSDTDGSEEKYNKADRAEITKILKQIDKLEAKKKAITLKLRLGHITSK